jgi:dihydroorotate dehydrogenase electron transfer subunit
MHTGNGQVVELIFSDGCRYLRVSCPPNVVPAPGQYLLASDGSDSPLPVPLFYTDFAPDGFMAPAPVNCSWSPGEQLLLRGPLGRGFTLPAAAHRVGLVAFDDSTARLKGLIIPALKQDAAVVLVSDSSPDDLPDDVEVQPLSLLSDVVEWADYAALDVGRENLRPLRERLGNRTQLSPGMEVQVLIRTPVPCGGMGECGVCAVNLKSDWTLACKDGPVFDWRDLD